MAYFDYTIDRENGELNLTVFDVPTFPKDGYKPETVNFNFDIDEIRNEIFEIANDKNLIDEKNIGESLDKMLDEDVVEKNLRSPDFNTRIDTFNQYVFAKTMRYGGTDRFTWNYPSVDVLKESLAELIESGVFYDTLCSEWTKLYETMGRYAERDDLNDKQMKKRLERIEKINKNNIIKDKELLENSELFSKEQKKMLAKFIDAGIPFDNVAKLSAELSRKELWVIKSALKYNLEQKNLKFKLDIDEVSKIAQKHSNKPQRAQEIISLLKLAKKYPEYDIASIIERSDEFSIQQLQHIKYGFECGIDASIYANPSFSPSQMNFIRSDLEFNKSYPESSICVEDYMYKKDEKGELVPASLKEMRKKSSELYTFVAFGTSVLDFKTPSNKRLEEMTRIYNLTEIMRNPEATELEKENASKELKNIDVRSFFEGYAQGFFQDAKKSYTDLINKPSKEYLKKKVGIKSRHDESLKNLLANTKNIASVLAHLPSSVLHKAIDFAGKTRDAGKNIGKKAIEKGKNAHDRATQKISKATKNTERTVRNMNGAIDTFANSIIKSIEETGVKLKASDKKSILTRAKETLNKTFNDFLNHPDIVAAFHPPKDEPEEKKPGFFAGVVNGFKDARKDNDKKENPEEENVVPESNQDSGKTAPSTAEPEFSTEEETPTEEQPAEEIQEDQKPEAKSTEDNKVTVSVDELEKVVKDKVKGVVKTEIEGVKTDVKNLETKVEDLTQKQLEISENLKAVAEMMVKLEEQTRKYPQIYNTVIEMAKQVGSLTGTVGNQTERLNNLTQQVAAFGQGLGSSKESGVEVEVIASEPEPDRIDSRPMDRIIGDYKQQYDNEFKPDNSTHNNDAPEF